MLIVIELQCYLGKVTLLCLDLTLSI